MITKDNNSFLKLISIIFISLVFVGISVSQNPVKTYAASVDNAITKFKVTSDKGNIDKIGKWEVLKVEGEFALPNNKVKKGDTTTIKIPQMLTFIQSHSFDIKTKDGEVVADAKIDIGSKTLTLTYTDFPEKYSDVKGNFYFFCRIDHDKYQEKSKVPMKFEVEGKVINGGESDYDGIGDEKAYPFVKWGSRSSKNDKRLLHFGLEINRTKQDIKDAIVSDNLVSEGLSVEKDSVKIYKGKWVIKNKAFQLEGRKDVTKDFNVGYTPDGKGFSIKLGHIQSEDGYEILYHVKASYDPIDGEIFENNAILRGNNEKIKEYNAKVRYLLAKGTAEGYRFKIKVLKKSDDGSTLAGAKFKVTRDATGQDLGTFISGDDGTFEVKGLLKDDYTITEVESPKGFKKLDEPIRIKPEDFGSDKIARKEVVNQRFEKIKIQGKKTWNDGDNQDGKRPKKIVVKLLADGEETAKKDVTEADEWKYSFDDLPKYKDGKVIMYSVVEEKVPGYTPKTKGYDIENSYTPETTYVKVTKVWKDKGDKDKLRPESIRVQLYADGKAYGKTVVLSVLNKWGHTWANLTKMRDGKKIDYKVREVAVPKGYKSSVEDEDLGDVKIVNTHEVKPKTPETGDSTNTEAYGVVLVLSLIGLITLVVAKKEAND